MVFKAPLTVLSQASGLKQNAEFDASGLATVLLYMGLGMVTVGLVITLVGVGDKGFKTFELKMVGPGLVGCGGFLAVLRILFCTVPACWGWSAPRRGKEDMMRETQMNQDVYSVETMNETDEHIEHPLDNRVDTATEIAVEDS